MKTQSIYDDGDEMDEQTTPGKRFKDSSILDLESGMKKKIGSRRGSSSSSSRAFYVEENIMIQNSHVNRAGSILKEAAKIINDFWSVCDKTHNQREIEFVDWQAAKKKLKISFWEEYEIDKI
jgi:hypothetical protein